MFELSFEALGLRSLTNYRSHHFFEYLDYICSKRVIVTRLYIRKYHLKKKIFQIIWVSLQHFQNSLKMISLTKAKTMIITGYINDNMNLTKQLSMYQTTSVTKMKARNCRKSDGILIFSNIQAPKLP